MLGYDFYDKSIRSCLLCHNMVFINKHSSCWANADIKGQSEQNAGKRLISMNMTDVSFVLENTKSSFLNSYPPSAYMRQWIGSALVQIMAWRLVGAKPLPEPMLAYCQLDSWEQISVKFEPELWHFHSRKCIWNCRMPKRQPFCPGGDD